MKPLLLARLKELGLAENTLVVFTSDNGGTQQSSQEPLRGNKGGYYEGGIREPFIAHWPGTIQAGGESPVPVHQIDLYPTFLAATELTKANELLDDLLGWIKSTGAPMPDQPNPGYHAQAAAKALASPAKKKR